MPGEHERNRAAQKSELPRPLQGIPTVTAKEALDNMQAEVAAEIAARAGTVSDEPTTIGEVHRQAIRDELAKIKAHVDATGPGPGKDAGPAGPTALPTELLGMPIVRPGPGPAATMEEAPGIQFAEWPPYQPTDHIFVCRTCLDTFCLPRDGQGVRCVCGESTVERMSNGTPLCSPSTIPVTDLVKCGKLSVHAPNPLVPVRLVGFLTNRIRRGPTVEPLPQQLAAQRASEATEAVDKVVDPALSFLKSACQLGARVSWQAHYHTRPVGIETDRDGAQFARRAATGDARFVGQVLTCQQTNENDRSLVFHDVGNCARCGKDHTALGFWKLGNPVRTEDAAAPGGWKVDATHFAYCPVNGEPILLLEETVDPELSPIDGPEPADAPPISTATGPATKGYSEGEDAGRRKLPRESNPHPAGSLAHRSWDMGHRDAGGPGHG